MSGPRERAVLSLGSNIGDRTAQLQTAVASLGRTRARGVVDLPHPALGRRRQDDFYNIVVHRRGRRRRRPRVVGSLPAAGEGRRSGTSGPLGSATLDADVITVELHGHPVISDDPELTLPHPRAAERAFVLAPWAEVDPTAELPGAGPIADLLDGLDTAGITRVGHVR